ncbi:MAG: M28 family peptidase [Anaerolineae bacterium]|nr:M28 family peptidase [Anaerolineae bacterium]
MIGLIAIAASVAFTLLPGPSSDNTFSGDRAYEHVVEQMKIGPRIPGSDQHQQVIEYITRVLQNAGWTVEIHQPESTRFPVKNIIARRGDAPPRVILGAHYDTRALADQDPDPAFHSSPVPGANDGASGVAVLLEMARVLPKDQAGVWLVFFDAEDQGGIGEQQYIYGSSLFAEYLLVKYPTSLPEAVVVVDMIGDADQQIYIERTSNQILSEEIWSKAGELGFSSTFIPETKYAIIDDHTPFLRAGIPAVDLIDFDYPYWHTTADTLDKISPESLGNVGLTLTAWLDDFLSGK